MPIIAIALGVALLTKGLALFLIPVIVLLSISPAIVAWLKSRVSVQREG